MAFLDPNRPKYPAQKQALSALLQKIDIMMTDTEKRIEKWVMEMQDVDYDLLYEPGKDNVDPRQKTTTLRR
ncbi:hypothetical protein OS493_012125 [Desmophyllum pertusum]|uniref:Uncharacterized protein n=1 Tax=Desmophyllum pertusum TaxID=174260 RepID=A0A9X0A2Y0_9CNID|nr:hypothetical protein OS493_012125 [Desmophyllum pertusum]